MKKVLSVILCLVMLMSVGIVGVSAAYEAEQLTKYPVIMVPGFMASTMYKIDEETGEEVVVFGWSEAADMVVGAGGGNLGGIITEFGEYLLAGNVKPIAKRLGEGFNRIFGDLKSNPDGSPTTPIYTVENTPEKTNFRYLQEAYPDGKHQHEGEIMAEVCNAVGAENAYAFQYDFRLGAVEAAEVLKDYIDDVIEYTNKNREDSEKIDKVNIIAVSHGGQVTGTYLSLYGEEGKVNNAVLTIPALGGAGIAYDAFNYNHDGFTFGDVGLLVFIQHAMLMEEDYHYLLEAGLLGFLDELASALVPYCFETIGNWCSLWDFIPVEHYEDLKAELLDEEENAGLIEKSDFMHYEVMSEDGEHYYGKGFKKAQAAGTNVYIIAGYDIQIVTGMPVSSDAIIPTKSATGATCAPFGERFNDGYTQKVDTGFYQVSPSMTVDASTCYIPEHTWLVQDYHHGMTYKDEYTRNLMYTLALNDKSYDVHSMKEYPQFHATTNPAHAVYASFNKSADGFVSKEDTSLIIKNICNEGNVLVSTITLSGIDSINFDVIPFVLKPGESKEVKFSGALDEVSLKNFEIDITYFIDNITPLGERTFDFTIMNGEPVEFDSENPTVASRYDDKMGEFIDKDTTDILDKFGVDGIVSVVFNIVYKIYEIITRIINYFA